MKVRIKLLGLTLLPVLAAIGSSQTGANLPSDWTATRENGTITLRPTASGNVWMKMFDVKQNRPDVATWMKSQLANLQVDQADEVVGVDGQPLRLVLAEDPSSGNVYVVIARPQACGVRAAVLGADNINTAASNLHYLVQAASTWQSWPQSRFQSSHSGDGTNGASGYAGAESSGGGPVNAQSTSVTSGNRSSSSSSSHSSASSSSQQSSSDSMTRSDHKSQSNHQNNSNSDRDSRSMQNSQSNRDSKSNHSSQSNSSKDFHKQVVYDPARRNLVILDSADSSARLDGAYAYQSDLFASPIGASVLSPSASATISFDGGHFRLAGKGSGTIARNGSGLTLSYPNNQIEAFDLAVLETLNGVVTKFAIGPCVYSRTT